MVDKPWHVGPPIVPPPALSLSDEKINEQTKEFHGASPTFRPAAEWHAEFGQKLRAAGVPV